MKMCYKVFSSNTVIDIFQQKFFEVVFELLLYSQVNYNKNSLAVLLSIYV